jgi:hypothetical protein
MRILKLRESPQFYTETPEPLNCSKEVLPQNLIEAIEKARRPSIFNGIDPVVRELILSNKNTLKDQSSTNLLYPILNASNPATLVVSMFKKELLEFVETLEVYILESEDRVWNIFEQKYVNGQQITSEIVAQAMIENFLSLEDNAEDLIRWAKIISYNATLINDQEYFEVWTSKRSVFVPFQVFLALQEVFFKDNDLLLVIDSQ